MGGGGEEENLWIMVRTWTDWNPIRDLIGMRAFKEGVDVTVRE
jgi:hypothetical protein